MSAPSLSRAIVRQALARRAAGIPRPIIEKTRLHIADATGIAIAAGRDFPSLRESPFEGIAGAAFTDAALMHALDYDDIHDAARLHPTTVTLAAARAAASRFGGEAETLRVAVALGNELMCRLGLMWKPSGTGPGSDWFLTQLFGYFGAALAAGLVMGLDEDALVSAMGLAYMQAAGGKEAGFGVGSNARSIYPAFASLGGVQAALLARGGIVGPEGAFDGAAGLFKVYLGTPASDAQLRVLLDDAAWNFGDTDVKPWPCCRLSHPYVAAAFELRASLGDAAVRRVVALVNASAAKLCRPLESRRIPRTLQDAKYSIPFMTAFALAHGRVDLDNLGPQAIDDRRALELAARVEIEESLPDNPGHPAAVVIVETDRGALRSGVGRPPRLDAAGIRAKFDTCLAHAGRSADAQRLWASC
jgi:2-methylcitrate dehydratase PrpD